MLIQFSDSIKTALFVFVLLPMLSVSLDWRFPIAPLVVLLRLFITISQTHPMMRYEQNFIPLLAIKLLYFTCNKQLLHSHSRYRCLCISSQTHTVLLRGSKVWWRMPDLILSNSIINNNKIEKNNIYKHYINAMKLYVVN